MSLQHILSEDDYRFYKENISSLEERIVDNFPEAYINPDILSAVRKVPRHLFVNPGYGSLAYTDNALPTIGGMTTSAPSVIGEMIFGVGISRGDRLLEIGTGTGYEAAVLAEMGVRVFSIEVDGSLAKKANRTLTFLGYKIDQTIEQEIERKECIRRYNKIKSSFPGRGSVEIFWGNGQNGLEAQAPFKSIIVAASIAHVNLVEKLFSQLSQNGGRLIVPIGPRHRQNMHIFERNGKHVRTFVSGGTSYDFVRMKVENPLCVFPVYHPKRGKHD